MKAIELTGTVDDRGNLSLDELVLWEIIAKSYPLPDSELK